MEMVKGKQPQWICLNHFFSTAVVPGTSTETHVLVARVGVGTDHEIVPSLPNLPIQITVETKGEGPHVV